MTELALQGYPGLLVHDWGLEFTQLLSWEQMETLGGDLQGAFIWSRACLPLYLGDWLNQAELQWSDTYTQLVHLTGLAADTLRSYKWVTGKVCLEARKVCARAHTLRGITALRLVAPLEPEEQKRWLEKAEREEMTTRELGAALKPSIPIDCLDDSTPIPDMTGDFWMARYDYDRACAAAKEMEIAIADQDWESCRRLLETIQDALRI